MCELKSSCDFEGEKKYGKYILSRFQEPENWTNKLQGTWQLPEQNQVLID